MNSNSTITAVQAGVYLGELLAFRRDHAGARVEQHLTLTVKESPSQISVRNARSIQTVHRLRSRR
jgi:hypothetical protein